MTGVRLTAAQARRLGIDAPSTGARRTTRKEASGPYHTRCHACRIEFTTMASEDRHVTLTHSRFELIL